MPRFVAKRFAVPAGMIANVAPDPGRCVGAALHHAVAAPHEEQVGAFVERAAHALGCLLALRDLVPEGVDAPVVQMRRSSSSPPPSDLPECAITATRDVMAAPPRLERPRGCTARPRGKNRKCPTTTGEVDGVHLFVLFLAGVICGGPRRIVVFLVVNRDPNRATARRRPRRPRACDEHELVNHRCLGGSCGAVRARRSVTGLALTVALALLVAWRCLAFEVRRQSASWPACDLHIARWAADARDERRARGSSAGSPTSGAPSVLFVITTAGRDLRSRPHTHTRCRACSSPSSVIGVGFANNLAKVIVGRPRPEVDQLVHVSGMSFPSGHSAGGRGVLRRVRPVSRPAAPIAARSPRHHRRRRRARRHGRHVTGAAGRALGQRRVRGAVLRERVVRALARSRSVDACCASVRPVEAATRVDAAADVEVEHGPRRQSPADDDGDRAEHGADRHV